MSISIGAYKMSKINICGHEEINDPFYRYTMEKVIVIREKHQTVIPNISAVAKDLDRNEALLVHFFKKEFGCNFVYKHGKLTTTTILTVGLINDVLKDFIEYLVLCPVCRLSETEIMIFKKNKKNKHLVMDCKACSFNGNINTTTIKSKAVVSVIESLVKKV